MKPCIWSSKMNAKDGTGWFRGGDDIKYFQNDIPRDAEGKGDKQTANINNNTAFLYNNNGAGEGVDFYFTFSFTYEFEPNSHEEVWFAHAVPYTYTQMQENLKVIREDPAYNSFLKFNILCPTLARCPAPLVTITENVKSYLDYYEE